MCCNDFLLLQLCECIYVIFIGFVDAGLDLVIIFKVEGERDKKGLRHSVVFVKCCFPALSLEKAIRWARVDYSSFWFCLYWIVLIK